MGDPPGDVAIGFSQPYGTRSGRRRTFVDSEKRLVVTSDLALLAGLATSLYMTGVIAVVQWVHYPLFDRVHPEAFARYHADHMRLMTPIVAMPMLVELVSSVVLVFYPTLATSKWPIWCGLLAVMVAWIVTGFVSVPLHQRLAAGFDEKALRVLVRSNWIRTAAWSVHSLTLLVLAWEALRERGG
jgi:hypothetical protein